VACQSVSRETTQIRDCMACLSQQGVRMSAGWHEVSDDATKYRRLPAKIALSQYFVFRPLNKWFGKEVA